MHPRASRALPCALLVAIGCGDPAPPPGGIAARLDRTSVHVHLALRDRLAGPGGRVTAAAVARAAESPSEADRLGRELFDARDRGRDRLRAEPSAPPPLAPLLAEGAAVDAETDRALFLLALTAETASDDRRVPKQILVYEASRLRPEEVEGPVVRSLARAAAALTFARAAHCDEVEGVLRGDAAIARADVEAAVAGPLSEAELDPAVLHADLASASRVLVGGARACCALFEGRDEPAARIVDGWLDDAEALGVPRSRLDLLRAWTALVEGRRDDARALLEDARGRTIDPEDAPRYALVRDALASEREEDARDAAHRMLDRRWLSGLALSATVGALERDGLLTALDRVPAARAHRQLAAGEAAIIAAARRREPLFDQAHQGDRGALDRLRELFE